MERFFFLCSSSERSEAKREGRSCLFSSFPRSHKKIETLLTFPALLPPFSFASPSRAHAEYAWLAFEDGDLETARAELERALDAARRAGCAVTDSEIADEEYKLGRVQWTMGGAERDDPGAARAHFEAASVEEGDCQAAACAWLGHWYREVARDARPCAVAHRRFDEGRYVRGIRSCHESYTSTA